MAKALRLPLDMKIITLTDVPYTISYVIRKHIQLDGLFELPKDKRPSDKLIWDGTSEEMDIWFDKMLKGKLETQITEIVLSDAEIER